MLKPVITLLTDFGQLDPYVGIMKGVILGICPEARIVDLTHEVIPYEIPQAAFLLQQSWLWFPKGSIHVVVVDPGVGTSRRPILVEAGGHRFIGPDNGVFSMLKAEEVREIAIDGTVSNTFHGRDVFAPTAARLARGTSEAELGELIGNHVRLTLHEPVRSERGFEGRVLHIDHFGNVITNFRASDFAGPMEIRAGSETVAKRVRTYGEVPQGELVLIEGSSGYLEIALNQGSAAERLGIGVGAVLEART